MTTPLVLFGTALLLGAVGGRPLVVARWARQSPRLAVALWHALCFGVVSSVVLGGVALAMSALPLVMTGTLSEFLAQCSTALRAAFAAPSSLALGTAGLLIAGGSLGRLLACASTSLREARQVRHTQLASLALAGHRVHGEHGDDLVVLMDDRPAAYCLPGRGGGTIVVSSGTLDVLADDQVRLVLAHERAHLRQHHHLATRLSAALARAFGRVPLFRLAGREVPLLLEMAADDSAIRWGDTGHLASVRVRGTARRRLAHAVVSLASAQTSSPVGALAAAGGSAVARVHRLSEPPLPLGAIRAILLGIGIAAAFAGPLLVASAPALCAAAMEICPFAFA